MRNYAFALAALAGLILWVALAWFVWTATVKACESEPITPNTPTGIAGCLILGEGIASHYGPGSGVAMNFCTWELRHADGCGMVALQSHATGLVVTVPVVDFCDCYTGTDHERIVDLQYGVVAALGLDRADGLYEVTVWREGLYPAGEPAGRGAADETSSLVTPPTTDGAAGPGHSPQALPDTAMRP